MPSSSHPAPAPVRHPVEPAPGPVPVPAPAPPHRRRWWVPAGMVIAALIGGALYLALRTSAGPKTGGIELARTAIARTGPLERIIRVSGATSARNYALLMVPTFRGPDSGRDLTLIKLAKAGSFVKKGEVVAQLDAQTLQDHIDDTNDTVEQAENDVKKKRAEQTVEWEALQQDLRVAKADLDKATLDYQAAEVKTDIERELLKISMDEAGAAYKQMQTDVANKRAADRAELRILEITALRQHRHLNNHVGDLQKFQMRAPMDGLIVMQQTFRAGEMRQIQEGDQVYPGQQFMRIVDLRSMQLEAYVSQADSADLRVGQTATVGLDAFPGLTFKGRVYSIAALGVKGMWDTYFIRNLPVKILIEGNDPRLIPDLSGWAHVLIDRTDNSILVPLDAVQYESGRPFVYVQNGTEFEKRAVEVAAKTVTQAAVRSGLKPGETVALRPPAAK